MRPPFHGRGTMIRVTNERDDPPFENFILSQHLKPRGPGSVRDLTHGHGLARVEIIVDPDGRAAAERGGRCFLCAATRDPLMFGNATIWRAEDGRLLMRLRWNEVIDPPRVSRWAMWWGLAFRQYERVYVVEEPAITLAI